MKILTILILTISSGLVFSELKYNPHTGNYEQAPANSQLKYNPHSGSYSHERADSNLEYNPYSGEWEYER